MTWRNMLLDSLAGQVVAVLLAAVVLLQVAGFVMFRASMAEAEQAADEDYAAQLIAAASRVLAGLPEARRPEAAHGLSRNGLSLRWTTGPAATQPGPEPTHFGAHLSSVLAGSPAAVVGVSQPASNRHRGSVAVEGGGVLAFEADFSQFHPAATPLLLGYAFALAVLASAAAVWLVHNLSRPLRDVARAADAVGLNGPVPVMENGPAEVRRVARAFNRMQARIQRLVEDRTMALAAVSHDLRTPMTRMRLDAEAIKDTHVRDRLDTALDEMDAMIGTTLAYVQGDPDSEPARAVDLVTLLQTMVEAAEDAGHRARFDGPRRAVLPLRVSAIRRAFSNLVDNAIHHGGSVQVTLAVRGDGLQVDVEDDGPGIPQADLDRVFQPFLRLEAAGEGRAGRRSPGVGLGLTIARRAIEAGGGSLTLASKPEGGLSARVVLPGRPVA